MRVIIIGGPLRGKSTLAHDIQLQHRIKNQTRMIVRCGDPASTVKIRRMGVEYLPEGLDFNGDHGAAKWVALNWLTLDGPWICEGHVMARALRRWREMRVGSRMSHKPPCEKIIVLDRKAWVPELPGQARMHAGVMTVWESIAHHFKDITEVRKR